MNNNENLQPKSPINSKRLLSILVLLSILAAIPVTVLLVQRRPGEFEVRTRAEEYATLNLKTDQDNYDINEEFTLEIELDTGNQPAPVIGVDVILNYNSSILETSTDRITGGAIFDTFPIKNVDPDNNRIVISGGASVPENFFTGTGTFATIGFTAKTNGAAEFSFVWEGSDATTDTNVVGLVGGEAVERLRTRPAGKTITIRADHASLTLESASYAYNVGDAFDMVINLDTGLDGIGEYNETVGTDVILTYDPTILQGNGIRVGSIYDNYQRADINASQQRIEISGTASTVENYFAGTGLFATVEFVALSEGSSRLDFVWDGAGATGDTNVVGPGPVDLLVSAPEGKSIVVLASPSPETHRICQNSVCLEVDGPGTDECLTDRDCITEPLKPLLNLRVNLLERLASVGSVGVFKLQVLEVPGWYKNVEIASSDGIFSGLVLDDLPTGSSYTFYIKGPSHLAKKVSLATNLAVGDNPPTEYLDFGDLIPGDIHIGSGATETDGVINSFDTGKVFVEWNTGLPIASIADFNGDQQVNVYDIGIIFKYFGSEADL